VRLKKMEEKLSDEDIKLIKYSPEHYQFYISVLDTERENGSN
jgi:transcription antitermination factor NusA-like protein